MAPVEHSRKDLTEFLRGDTRLTSDTLNGAFTQAAAQGKWRILPSMYNDERVSASTLLVAFQSALHAECVHVAGTIANGVSTRPDVPQDTRDGMFVSAATHDQIELLQILTRGESKDWPLDVLKNALEVSHQRSASWNGFVSSFSVEDPKC